MITAIPAAQIRGMRMNEYSWKTINVSPDTYKYLRARRKPFESMNSVVRRALKLPVPDPTRAEVKRSYYKEDKK